MKLIISYQPANFQIPQLSESNFTEIGIRHPQNNYDVTSQYLVFKIAQFVELNRSYQHAKFHWPRLSGSNFTWAGGKHPSPDLTRSQMPSPYRVNLFMDDGFSTLLHIASANRAPSIRVSEHLAWREPNYKRLCQLSHPKAN